MQERENSFVPIGTIHTPFEDIKGMPIQPRGATGIKGEIHSDCRTGWFEKVKGHVETKRSDDRFR